MHKIIATHPSGSIIEHYYNRENPHSQNALATLQASMTPTRVETWTADITGRMFLVESVSYSWNLDGEMHAEHWIHPAFATMQYAKRKAQGN